MPTKQDLFMYKLKQLGGEANTRQMMKIMDEDDHNIRDLSYNLRRRGKIKIVRVPLEKFPYRMNKFIIIKKRKKWQ